MNNLVTIICIALSLISSSCGDKEKQNANTQSTKPQVSNNGALIKFSSSENLSFIKTEKISFQSIKSEMVFPARVAATSVASQEGAGKNIILFEDPQLTFNYTELIQTLININQIQNVSIKQRKIELDRAKDLAANGAATGKEVLEAETALSMENTNLNNEKASIIEHEAILKLGGFDPARLLDAPAGKVWIVSEVPETLLQSIKKGSPCSLTFSSFPGETFDGNIEAIGDVVNSNTRLVKLRLALNNPNTRMKAGMFGTMSFDNTVANALSVPKQSLVIVQGKTYVFVKSGEMQFERKELVIGSVVNDRAIVISGLNLDNEVVTEGSMQLKGLSFGY